MRTTTVVTLLLGLAVGGCAEPGGEADSEAPADAEATAPASEVDAGALETWNVRFDREDPSGDFLMVEEGGGWHVTTGPAGIAWRAADLVESGDYAARASFRELSAQPGHREAFGLIVGGFHLESPDQKYTYFLVRGTGDYLIKQRSGEETRTLVDWTPSDAVRAIEGQGEGPTNALAVRVRGDSVHFAVNDRVVETLPSDQVEPYGLVGIRVNHRLDLQVTDFAVEGAGGQG